MRTMIEIIWKSERFWSRRSGVVGGGLLDDLDDVSGG
jgi:hypothetical protein